MIAFNERLEAANLLRLLKESRSRLEDFNADDERIARASGVDHADPVAAAQARLAWYLRLALWAEERRLSGCCSLVFSRMDRVQRAPYDLLACYPLTASEKERADVPLSLFAGLNERARDRELRLYHRLLCITPMRRLLERLCELARLVRKHGAEAEPLLKLTGDSRWRQPILMTEERRSGQSLSLRDNDFTIIDRLMANHGRTLRRSRVVRIPRPLLGHAEQPESLLLAAIAGSLDRTEERGSCTRYRMIPGGHVRLDVYRSGASEDFLERARTDQEKRAERLVYIRPYAGCRLIQLPRGIAGRIPCERRRRLQWRGAVRPGVRWRVCVPQEPKYLADAALSALDWQALCSCILSLSEPEAPAAAEGATLCLRDNGGNAAYRMLRRAMAEDTVPAAKPRKEAQPMDSERCMFEFFRGAELSPAHLERAMAELRRHTALLFAADELPDKYSSDPARPITNFRAGWQARAIKLLLAYAAGERLIADERLPGRIPATVDAALTGLACDETARQRFHALISALENGRDTKLLVNVRYCSTGKRKLFLCYATPLRDDAALKSWVASGGGDPTGLSAEELAAACAFGLRRHLFMQTGVTTPAGRGFRLAVNTRGVPKEADLLFRLLVIHGALRLAQAQNAPVGTTVQAKLKKDYACTEKCFLAVVGKGTLAFVGEGEQTGTLLADFTPERLPEIASLAFRWNLRITAGPEDEDDVCLERVP